MALRIQCPGCRNPLQVEDAHRGRQVRCPTCHAIMQVPGPAQPAPVSQAITSSGPALSNTTPSSTALSGPSRPTLTAPLRECGVENPAEKVTADRGRWAVMLKGAGRMAWSQSKRLLQPVATTAMDPTRTGRAWFLAGAGSGLALLFALQFLLGGLGESSAAGEQLALNVKPGQPTKTPETSSPPVPQSRATQAQPAVTETKLVPDPSKQEVKTTSNYPAETKSKKVVPVKVAPPPKQVEPPPPPAPPDMAPETTIQVKNATAYLRVTQGNGMPVEGSGFFAAEAGLVVTNAHVLGMMEANSKPPTKVEVVVHSGEPGQEFTLTGQVLGVDYLSDLGILRVTGDTAKLPAPLPLDGSQSLRELQKVFVFGFPFGASLGKNITISATSVSSIRKNQGIVTQIQVNGGMNPGNSGGPVVDTRGAVIGVAVAIIKGTQINFAVPGEKVQGLLRGRVTDVEFGEPYLDNGQVKLPVHVACVDPLQRIAELRAEIWTGGPGATRPLSTQQPKPVTGDGPRMVVPLQYQNGKAEGAVLLPKLTGDQVLWVQPAVSDGGGSTLWASASSYKPSDLPPLQRAAVTLQRRFTGQPDCTVKFRREFKLGASSGMSLKEDLEATALEKVQADPRGGQIRLTFGPCSLTRTVGDKTVPANPQAQNLMRSRDLAFTTDHGGTVIQRAPPKLELFYPPGLRQGFDDSLGVFTNAYEMTCISVPNKLVQPQESWSVRLPMSLFGTNVDLVLNSTFEGTRVVEGKEQAVIRLAGTMAVRQQGLDTSKGKVTGRVHFGIQEGMLTRAELLLDIEGSPEPLMHMQVSLTRTPGAPPGVTPAEGKQPKARLNRLQNWNASLSPQDRADDPLKQNCFYKSYSVNLTAGHTYLLEMNASGQGNLMDPYLVLFDGSGQKCAEDDDSGGHQNALIIFKAPATGEYQIHATTCEAQRVGPFTLRVSEIVSKE